MKTLKAYVSICAALAVATSVHAAEYHVSAITGGDGNPGSEAKPFKTISAAAQVARPGDVITVHEGVYRERVNPLRGGTSDDQRIVYQAVPGEKVIIKGSEVIKNWVKVQDDVWKVSLPNTFFGAFNSCARLFVNLHRDIIFLCRAGCRSSIGDLFVQECREAADDFGILVLKIGDLTGIFRKVV